MTTIDDDPQSASTRSRTAASGRGRSGTATGRSPLRGGAVLAIGAALAAISSQPGLSVFVAASVLVGVAARVANSHVSAPMPWE